MIYFIKIKLYKLPIFDTSKKNPNYRPNELQNAHLRQFAQTRPHTFLPSKITTSRCPGIQWSIFDVHQRYQRLYRRSTRDRAGALKGPEPGRSDSGDSAGPLARFISKKCRRQKSEEEADPTTRDKRYLVGSFWPFLAGPCWPRGNRPTCGNFSACVFVCVRAVWVEVCFFRMKMYFRCCWKKMLWFLMGSMGFYDFVWIRLCDVMKFKLILNGNVFNNTPDPSFTWNNTV